MISINHFPQGSTGLLVSVKNGAWFESQHERGFTNVAVDVLRGHIADMLIAAGIPESSFWMRVSTTADRVRIAVFCRPSDVTQMLHIVRDSVECPSWSGDGIQEALRTQRIDYIRAYCDPYFRAVTAVTRRLSDRNPSVFGSARFYLRAVGPSTDALAAYWKKLWSASARDVLVFGDDGERHRDAVVALSHDTVAPAPCKISTQKVFATRGCYGVSWHESCYNPLYNILDTVMVNRAEASSRRTVFSVVDKGTLRAYAVSKFFGAKKKWEDVFAKSVTIDEWQRAKNDWLSSIGRVLSGDDLFHDIFEWDDCTPVAYGNPDITSLQSLARYVEKSGYEEFVKYWNETIEIG